MAPKKEISDAELARTMGIGLQKLVWWRRLGTLHVIHSAELAGLLGLACMVPAEWLTLGFWPGVLLGPSSSVHSVRAIDACLAAAPRRNWDTPPTIDLLRRREVVLLRTTAAAGMLDVKPATVRKYLHQEDVLQGIRLRDEWRVTEASVCALAAIRRNLFSCEEVRLATGYSLTLLSKLAGQGKLALVKRQITAASLFELLASPGTLPPGTDVQGWFARRLAEQEMPLPQNKAAAELGVPPDYLADMIAENLVEWIRTPGQGRGVRTFVTASSIRAYRLQWIKR